MQPIFHLSIGVKSIEESVDFFTKLLKAKVLHRDPSGYVNIDLFGSQLTLKKNADVNPALPDFHFGVNLSLSDFNELSKSILETGRRFVHMEPEVWEAWHYIWKEKKCI